MQRRGVIKSLGGVSLFGMSGCLSSAGNRPMRGSNPDCVITESTDDVEPVGVSADGRLRDADVVVNMRWNARTQASIKTGERSHYEPDSDDARIVVVRAEVSNPTESEVTTPPYTFRLRRDTVSDVFDTPINPLEIPGYVDMGDGVTLDAGSTVNMLILFRVNIPEVRSATIGARSISKLDRMLSESDEKLRKTVAFNPTCDESLEIDAPPQQ
jgi:hypothetical protein